MRGELLFRLKVYYKKIISTTPRQRSANAGARRESSGEKNIYLYISFLAASSVLRISEQMVIGPTPPGTGVMSEHLGATLAKSTSPLSLYPLLVSVEGTRVVPTSIITAPGFTISSVTNSGEPSAAMMISASRQISLMFFVAEWHTVTVALPVGAFCISSEATGLPTMLLRPSTTQLAPRVFTL